MSLAPLVPPSFSATHFLPATVSPPLSHKSEHSFPLPDPSMVSDGLQEKSRFLVEIIRVLHDLGQFSLQPRFSLHPPVPPEPDRWVISGSASCGASRRLSPPSFPSICPADSMFLEDGLNFRTADQFSPPHGMGRPFLCAPLHPYRLQPVGFFLRGCPAPWRVGRALLPFVSSSPVVSGAQVSGVCM